ncbi:MAG: hypothetical protein GOV01_03625 [Candidatus Altiarchaeota archaeon]|nr:hypothetical protein [Candidatus Altiarchaeota archaeon]
MQKKLEFLKNFLSEEGVLDILVFGSSVRENPRPKDLDALILFDKKKDFTLASTMRDGGVSIELLTYDEIKKMNPVLKENLFSEAISLRWGTSFIGTLGFKPFEVFYYSSPEKGKRNFYFEFFGRGKAKGILKLADGFRLSNGVVIVPVSKSDIIREFFKVKVISFYSFRTLIQDSKSGVLKEHSIKELAGTY